MMYIAIGLNQLYIRTVYRDVGPLYSFQGQCSGVAAVLSLNSPI